MTTFVIFRKNFDLKSKLKWRQCGDQNSNMLFLRNEFSTIFDDDGELKIKAEDLRLTLKLGCCLIFFKKLVLKN